MTEAASGCEPAASNERIGLAYARRVTVSPDGTNVYVAAQSAHAITELARAVTPTVTSLSNGGGIEAGGNEITIEGSGFVEGATVEFVGAGRASDVHVESASTITAVAPPGRGVSYVVVRTSSGSSPVGGESEYIYGRLGGLDIAGYCEGLGYLGNGSGATTLLREGQVEGPEYAYENWACVNSGGAAVPIAVHGPAPSMDNACAVAFPNVPAHARAENPDNAFSWTCYEGAPPEETKSGNEGPTTLSPLK
ncbi:MAG TPA: IPT/TIG domain-containing protein, partial [Solirubrobacteraceae bacterium]